MCQIGQNFKFKMILERKEWSWNEKHFYANFMKSVQIYKNVIGLKFCCESPKRDCELIIKYEIIILTYLCNLMLCDMVSEDAFIQNITRDIFLISDPNIEFKGSLEPPR